MRWDIPLFLARAGGDQCPGLNDAMDRFVMEGLKRGMPLTLINHPTGPHAFDLMDDSDTTRHIVAQAIHSAAGVIAEIPQFKAGVTGVMGTPTSTFEFGGVQIKEPVSKAAVGMEVLGSSLNVASSVSTTIGSFQRRQQDATMQFNSGSSEVS